MDDNDQKKKDGIFIYRTAARHAYARTAHPIRAAINRPVYIAIPTKRAYAAHRAQVAAITPHAGILHQALHSLVAVRIITPLPALQQYRSAYAAVNARYIAADFAALRFRNHVEGVGPTLTRRAERETAIRFIGFNLLARNAGLKIDLQHERNYYRALRVQSARNLHPLREIALIAKNLDVLDHHLHGALIVLTQHLAVPLSGYRQLRLI